MIRSLVFEEWPQADQVAWKAALAPGERLKRGGRLSHLAYATRVDLEHRYGCFLGFLASEQMLDPHAAAGEQVTPGWVHAYVERARQDWSSVTISQSVYKLRRAAEALAPERSFTWLAEIQKDLAFLAHPRARFDKLVLTTELVEAGLTLAREARSARHVRPHWRAARFRSGVMIALLALCPIRIKNFAALSLNRSVQRIGESWCISLTREETKSRRADERIVPEYLTEWMDEYVSVHRPILALGYNGRRQPIGHGSAGSDQHDCGALWIAQTGKAMPVSSVTSAVEYATFAALGVRVSPHAFRAAAATSAAIHAGSNPYLASALLQHRDRRVTDVHYNRASSVSAAIAFRRLLSDFDR